MQRLPGAHIGFLLFVSILVLSIGGAPVLGDPDTAWHLAAGNLIRSTSELPSCDPWSFTAGGERWYNLSWLADICLSLLYSIGGFGALYGVTIIVFAASLVLMSRHALLRGAGILSIFMLLLPCLFVLYVETFARPNLFSLWFALAFYCLFTRHRTSKNLDDLLPLPFIMAFWVNLHGGFLFGFLLLGVFLLEALLQKDRARLRHIGITFALCLVATFFNPYGVEIYYGALKTLSGAFDRTYILEWQPIKVIDDWPMSLLLLLALCVGNTSDTRIALADRILFVLLLMLALSGIRYTPFAALLLLPALSLRLSSLLYESRWGTRVRALEMQIYDDMHKTDIRVLSAVFAVAACLFVLLPEPRDHVLKEPAGFPAKTFPVAEAQYVLQHYPTLRFFNHYNIGGYLDYLWHGKMKVFIDGRASSLFGEEVLLDYADFINSRGFGGKAERIISQYSLDGLIIPNTDKDAGYWQWNPDWHKVYQGPVATVYLRKDLVEKGLNQ